MGQQHTAFTLADLARATGAFTPEEAVALTLALAERLGWSEPPEQLDSIVVRADGTVHLPRPVNAAPALPADYANLLHRLLTHGRGETRPSLPGALLLLVARARGDIDLPAFASADEFRHALLRFLPRPAGHVIAAAVARAHDGAPAAARPVRRPERRVAGARVDELRRMLREADLERIALTERIRQLDADGLRPARVEKTAVDAAASPLADSLPPRQRSRAAAASVLGLCILLGGLAWAGRGVTPARAPEIGGVAQTASAGDAPARRETAVDIAGEVVSPPPLSARLGPRPSAEDESRDGAEKGDTSRARAEIAETASPGAGRTADTSRRTSPDGREPGSGEPRTPSDRHGLQTLNVPARPAYSPSFSADGASVYFHAQDGGRSRLMRAETGLGGDVLEVATIVDDGARNFHVRLSPDGSHVAFDSDRDGGRAVYVARRDGSGVRRISGPGYAAVPVWSPGGRELLYIRAEPGAPRTWNLWRVSLDSGREQRVTSHKYGQAWPGSWFPDAQRVGYTHEDRLYVHDVRTGKSRSIASPIKGRLVRTAAVSPDGRHVAFQVFRDGMWLLDLRDGSMRRVLDDPTAEEFSWSPDGRRIAFHSRRQGHWGVWLMASPS